MKKQIKDINPILGLLILMISIIGISLGIGFLYNLNHGKTIVMSIFGSVLIFVLLFFRKNAKKSLEGGKKK